MPLPPQTHATKTSTFGVKHPHVDKCTPAGEQVALGACRSGPSQQRRLRVQNSVISKRRNSVHCPSSVVRLMGALPRPKPRQDFVTKPGSSSGDLSAEAAKDSVPSLDVPLLLQEFDLEANAAWHFQVLYPSLCIEEMRLGRARSPEGPGAIRIRAALVDFVVAEHGRYGFQQATLFLAVKLLDHLLAVWPVCGPGRMPQPLVAGAAALFVASKFEDGRAPSLAALVEAGGSRYTESDIIDMEVELLRRLEYRLHLPTAAHHLDWIQTLNSSFRIIETSSSSNSGNDSYDYWMVRYLGELGLVCAEAPHWPPSLHALAAVRLTNTLLGWPTPQAMLQWYCAESDTWSKGLDAVMHELWQALQQATQGDLARAVYRKYSDQDHAHVAIRAAQLVGTSFRAM